MAVLTSSPAVALAVALRPPTGPSVAFSQHGGYSRLVMGNGSVPLFQAADLDVGEGTSGYLLADLSVS